MGCSGISWTIRKQSASVVNKDLTLKAKAKDLTHKAKAKAKDLTLKAKAKAKDLTQGQGLDSQGQGLDSQGQGLDSQGQGLDPQGQGQGLDVRTS